MPLEMPETAEERKREPPITRPPQHERRRSSCEAHFISLEKTLDSFDRSKSRWLACEPGVEIGLRLSRGEPEHAISHSPILVGVNQRRCSTPGIASCLTRICGSPKL